MTYYLQLIFIPSEVIYLCFICIRTNNNNNFVAVYNIWLQFVTWNLICFVHFGLHTTHYYICTTKKTQLWEKSLSTLETLCYNYYWIIHVWSRFFVSFKHRAVNASWTSLMFIHHALDSMRSMAFDSAKSRFIFTK